MGCYRPAFSSSKPKDGLFLLVLLKYRAAQRGHNLAEGRMRNNLGLIMCGIGTRLLDTVFVLKTGYCLGL
ncbi:unnamed protein product [Cochlearia groenlandica]